MKLDHKSIKTRLYIIFWLIMGISLITIFLVQGGRYSEYAQMEDEVMAQIADEQKKAEELDKDSKYYESDAFVEKIAREQLGYIRSDEIIFYTDEE